MFNEHDGTPVVQENALEVGQPMTIKLGEEVTITPVLREDGIYGATMSEMSPTPFATLAINPGAKVFAYRKTTSKIVETTVTEVSVVATSEGQKVQIKLDGFQRVMPVSQVFLTREQVEKAVVAEMFQ